MTTHLEGPEEVPSVSPGLNDLQASLLFKTYVALGSSLPTSGHLKVIKREKSKLRPSIALITNHFGGRFCGKDASSQRWVE